MDNQRRADTHCIIIQLKPHNVGEPHYHFTLVDAFEASNARVESLSKEYGMGDISIPQVKANSLTKPGWILCLVFVVCLPMATICPMNVRVEDLADYKYHTEWKDRLGECLKASLCYTCYFARNDENAKQAPEGVTVDHFLDDLHVWWQVSDSISRGML